MMILAVSRRLPQLLELQRERTWQPLEGTELRDVTVGIVGLGSIGRAVAELATRVRLPGRRDPPPARGRERRGETGRRSTRARPVRRACRSCSRNRTSSCSRRRSRPRPRADRRRGARRGQARRVAHQRRPRPARRRAGAPAGAPRRAARRGRPRHVPRRAAAAGLAVLRPAERHRHAAHLVVERARPRSQRRAVLRRTSSASRPASRCSTSSTRAGLLAAPAGRPGRPVTPGPRTGDNPACRSPSSGLPRPARRPSSTR